MVYSEELGYDPDEWEECPPADHFLVFSPLTRLVLSLSAVGCAVLFFWLVDQNKNKGGSRREEEQEEKVQRVVPAASSPSSSPSSSGDILSTITGFLTGRGGDPDFVQRSFRDEERSPAAGAAAAVRDQMSKIDVRPDELSSSFHYKGPGETKTAADVRAEVDKAAFELRDLLGEHSDSHPPPVPPHGAAFPEWSNLNAPSLEFLGAIKPPSTSDVSESLHSAYNQAAEQAAAAYDRVGQAAHDAYDRAAAPVAEAFGNVGQTTQDALGRASDAAHDAYDRAAAPVADAYDSARDAAWDAYNRAAEPISDTYDSVVKSTQDTMNRAGQAAHDAYDRAAAPVADAFGRVGVVAHDTYDRVGEPLASVQQHAGQLASAAQEGASNAYDRAAQAAQGTGQAAQDAFGRATVPVVDAFGRAGQSAQDTLGQAANATRNAYDGVGRAAQDTLGHPGQAAQQAYDRAAQAAQGSGQAAQDAFGRTVAPVADAFGRVPQTAQDTLGRATDASRDAYDRARDAADDAYKRAAAPTADAYDRAAQAAQGAGQTAQDAFGRTIAPAADEFDRFGQATHGALGNAGQAAPVADAYDRAAQAAQGTGQAVQDAFGRATAPAPEAYDRFGQATRDSLAGAGRAAQDVYDRAVADAYGSVGEPATAAAQHAAAGTQDAYGRAQEAAARIIDPETARLEDDFERVQRDLDNLMAEHQVPLGVIIPGSSTSTSPAVSASRQQQQLQQQTDSSPIDEHVRQLTAGLLTSDGEQERKPSEIPSLHEIYEERQRQLSPPLASPVKIPTQEDRAALRHWEEELARKEQEKLSKLVDTIVGGDDISDIAASEGTEHLLPADRISMYSQDSATVQQLEGAPLRRGDENEQLPASAKINQKIDQISSALEQSLLSEIEQLARQTSTMQAELARARDSEYSTDELSEGAHDPRLDAFQPAGDVRFIPGAERPDQPAQVSHRNSERQSGESDDFVKITPPSHSGAPSPSPGVYMSSSEEEQLKRLVEEYDVIGSTSTLKKDASAPGALAAVGISTAAAPAATQQQQQPLPSPTTAALLQEYETVQPVQQLQQQQQHSPLSPYEDSPYAASPLLQQKKQQKPAAAHISPEEQAQLDQVLRDFEVTPGSKRKDVLDRPLPRTPPHTPENTLMDPFGRPLATGGEDREETVQFMMDGDTMSPTTELRFKLAPRGSIGELKLQFPRLPSEAGIEVVDPAVAHLPKDAFLPSDLEDVLASLANVDNHELYLPSQQQPDESVAAAAYVAGQDLQPQQHQHQQQPQKLQQETPILSATPEPIHKESADSLFSERKPTVVKVEGPAPAAPAAPHAAVQHLLQQAASLDLSQPLQPPMAAFDRPDSKPAPAMAVNADFVVRRQPGEEEEPHAALSVKPQMIPAFDVRIKKPAATASATIPQEELQKADAIFQDALDYMHAQQQPGKEAQPLQPQATGFIMEEDMLSSHGENAPRRFEKSADDTNKLIKTNERFERLDPHDDHDDMTYAPEIQSVEIPPDQLSETSELPHEDLPIDDVPLFKSPEAQKLEAEIRAQETAMEDAKNAMQHRAALAQAPHIISMNPHHPRFPSTPSISSAKDSPKALRKQSSLLSILGVTSTQEMLLKIDSLEALSNAMRKAGLDSTNVIFGIDYTASNKYQGEESFGGHSLHTIHPNLKNPYQQVITILGRTLAPFTTTGNIPVYGFGDAKTSDWSVFSLKNNGHCTTLEEVLKTYNEVTPTVELSGPTNFSPLIYQAIEICQRTREYHILVIIADGQVTNEKATRRAIVQACQYPLSIIVVGVGDGPWDMMRVFDESLPKRPWDNFHFVEFHEVCKKASGAADGDVKVAIQSLLEIPDQYRCICNLGLLKGRSPSIAHKNN